LSLDAKQLKRDKKDEGDGGVVPKLPPKQERKKKGRRKTGRSQSSSSAMSMMTKQAIDNDNGIESKTLIDFLAQRGFLTPDCKHIMPGRFRRFLNSLEGKRFIKYQP